MNADHYQKRARHRLVVATVVVCMVGAGIWYFSDYFSLSEVTLLGNSVAQFAETQTAKTFLAPPPLVNQSSTAKRQPPQSFALTVGGVIGQANLQRNKNGGLAPLTESRLLDDVATLRLEDMFANQYFAHVSPAGQSALTVASDVGPLPRAR